MSEKPDHYEVLGIEKKASEAEVKAAFKKIAMQCHPDRQRNKSDAEKAAAAEKFQLAKEAEEILTNASKRATYDQFGHNGIETMKNSGSSNCTAAPIARKPSVPTAEDAFAFFDVQKTGRDSGSAAAQPPSTTRRPTPEERAEERRRARDAERQRLATPTAPEEESTYEISLSVEFAMSRMKEASGVSLPVDVLERFRASLKELLKEVDTAIDRSRKNDGPKPK